MKKHIFLLIFFGSTVQGGYFEIVNSFLKFNNLTEGKSIIEFGHRGGQVAYEIAKNNPSCKIHCIIEDPHKKPPYIAKHSDLENLFLEKTAEGKYADAVLSLNALNWKKELEVGKHLVSIQSSIKDGGLLLLTALPSEFKKDDFSSFLLVLKHNYKNFSVKCNCFPLSVVYEMLNSIKFRCLQFSVLEKPYSFMPEDFQKELEIWFYDIPYMNSLSSDQRDSLLKSVAESLQKKSSGGNDPKKDIQLVVPMICVAARKN